MKRTIPLFITAIGGFILIVSVFIPRTEGWGEIAAIWFDVLAAIAFVLGGGNLIKIHLKKISDRAKGWAYSAITLIAFFATLYFGLFKVGSKPAAKQEFYGEVFATIPLDDLPAALTFQVKGLLPERGDGKSIPASVRKQLKQDGDQLVFRGWMTSDQKKDLIAYDDTLEWRATVEELHDAAQPKKELGKVAYHTDHRALGFKGVMSKEQRDALLKLKGADDIWEQAVKQLYEESNRTHSIALDALPKGVTIPRDLQKSVTYNDGDNQLSIKGPMSSSQRDALIKRFPPARPITGAKRAAFLADIESNGEALSSEQKSVFEKYLDGMWTEEQLVKAITDAGKVPESSKTYKEMLAEKKRGVKDIKSKKKSGYEPTLTAAHRQAIKKFIASETALVEELIDDLKQVNAAQLQAVFRRDGIPNVVAGMLSVHRTSMVGRQTKAIESFFSRVPTAGERNARLATALMKAGPLSDQQREFLTADYKRQEEWKATVGRLYVAAHTVKYAWSGEYRETGSPFWWMYEYAFKPLTATMFAMLAFYVASAAFRAFRAKNVEAALLLGTAFIILLGRTFAGVLLTSWMPEALSGLRIERLTVYIMQVFNTAGSRAIMIGISLGVVSTSLKVLLGVDRSYLGSAED